MKVTSCNHIVNVYLLAFHQGPYNNNIISILMCSSPFDLHDLCYYSAIACHPRENHGFTTKKKKKMKK